MGVDAADFDNSGKPGVAITNFDNEMIGLYRAVGMGGTRIGDLAGIGLPSKNTLGFGCVFLDANLDGLLDSWLRTGISKKPCATYGGTWGTHSHPSSL